MKFGAVHIAAELMCYNTVIMVGRSKKVIQFSGATKRFGTFAAVDNVTCSVAPGEVVGFVGENGAGKTTTINMLLGFTSPTSGSVAVFGERVTPATAHFAHRRMGYAAGDMELPGQMTGRQYLDFVMAQHRGKHASQRASLVKHFRPQLDKKMSQLSRGNKQKIALIAAFAANPELVVLDEPTSGLDPVMQAVFLRLVERERTKGTTIFMSSHYLQEVAEVCSRVLLMKNGRIVEDLSAAQLARTGGKTVRVVTTATVSLPKTHVSDVVHSHPGKYLETTFVYTGTAAHLTKWLGDLKGLHDVDISERTLEAEFRSIYDSTAGGRA